MTPELLLETRVKLRLLKDFRTWLTAFLEDERAAEKPPEEIIMTICDHFDRQILLAAFSVDAAVRLLNPEPVHEQKKDEVTATDA